MQITDIETIKYSIISRKARDEKGHIHPGEPYETTNTLTRIVVDDGPNGHAFGSSEAANDVARHHLVGEDPLYREKLWNALHRTQRLHPGTLDNKSLSTLDCALWDIAGKVAQLPVYKLLGATRESVPTYASTMVGDDDPAGLGTPEAYANFAESLVDRGFSAIKLHSWMPPFDHDPNRVVEMCAAVRKRVGPDVDLMLDSHHFYSRSEAKRIGDGISELDFRWFEEPMDEHSMSAYEWLTKEVDVPIIGPETAEGKMQTRAEWAKRGISDIGRVGVHDVGGITPAKKTANLYEAFCMECESHGENLPNLHVLCSMAIPGRYHEYGLLHPKYNFEENANPAVINVPHPDENGFIHVPQQPGLGYDIDWDYINEHRID
ncbi:enolase C-terminal domain-like protein [Haloferax sp. YSMS24]|uniref:enolase C-terminal domain-like protein n=1 Tax=Haloferax sp. YSMS24 TaxID=3388425 RepID=UPI00398D430E